MTIKEYLNRAYRIEKRIPIKKATIRRLKSSASNATSTLSALRSSGTSNHSKVEDCVTRYADLEAEVEKDTTDLPKVQAEIIHIIKLVPDNKLQDLLEMRYLQYKGWVAVAVNLELSEVYVRGKLHSKALQAAEVACKLLKINF